MHPTTDTTQNKYIITQTPSKQQNGVEMDVAEDGPVVKRPRTENNSDVHMNSSTSIEDKHNSSHNEFKNSLNSNINANNANVSTVFPMAEEDEKTELEKMVALQVKLLAAKNGPGGTGGTAALGGVAVGAGVAGVGATGANSSAAAVADKDSVKTDAAVATTPAASS